MARLWYVPFKKHIDEVSMNRNWTSLEDHMNRLENAGDVLTIRTEGTLTVSSDPFRWYAPFDLQLVAVEISVGTAPTGASIIVDIHNSGTTVFTDQGNRPEIAISSFVSGDAVPDVVDVVNGEYLEFHVDQIGSTIAGSDLTITVRYTKNV